MPVQNYYIDPNPDTVIVLRSPCLVFAPDPWEEAAKPIENDADPEIPPTPEEIPVENDADAGSISYGFQFADDEIPAPSEEIPVEIDADAEIPPPPEEIDIFDLGEATTNGESSSALLHEVDHVAEDPPPPEEIDGCDPDEAARYYVSSRHLSTASPWFRRMLDKNKKWNESEPDKHDGLLHLTAEDWDSDAFLTLLNIFHLKNRQVPRELSIDKLAKITVIVDYYECAEAVEMFSDIWIESLIAKDPIPSTYGRSLILWIWISWVFDRAREFERATLVAIKQCSEPIQTLGLPIPGRVSESINFRRYESMEHIIEGLHSLRDKYESLDYQCPLTEHGFECGSLLYGAITKEMLAMKLTSPRPEIPFADMNLEKLCAEARSMKNPMWQDQSLSRRRGYHVSYAYHDCNLTIAVTAIVDNVESTVSGLNLLSLKRALK